MKLDEIGFYTFSDFRARQTSGTSPLWRGEILLTCRCNFNCSYCQGLDPVDDISYADAKYCIELWLSEGLKNIRFSGGEPTLYPGITDLVEMSRKGGVERIGLSTNGSRSFSFYERLVKRGVDDISISLDANEPILADRMAGVPNQWSRVVQNIKALAKMTYVSVSIVFTEENLPKAKEMINFVHELNVDDIRIVTPAHDRQGIGDLKLEAKILSTYPILNYRVHRFASRKNIRGLKTGDCHRCHLVKDDSVVFGKWHYPCGVYLREGGQPIGSIGPQMRSERISWSESHDTHQDDICGTYCADMYIDYNNRVEQFHVP